MRVKILVVFGLMCLVFIAACDSSETPKYLEFASDLLLPQAPMGESYEFTFTVTYGEDKWDANTGFFDSEIIWGFDDWKLNDVVKTTGPANMTFSEGKISGTPDSADGGLWSFDVTIQKGKKFIVERFYLPISQNIEIVTDSTLSPATTDVDYSAYFSAKFGSMPYYWDFGNWTKNGTSVNDGPVGLTFSGSGYIEGKPDTSEVGDWTFDVTVFDTSIPNQMSITKTFSLRIDLKLEVPTNYPTIQAAVDTAGSGDIVYLTAGLYQGAGNRDVNFGGKTLTILGDPQNPSNVEIDCEGTFANPHRAFFLDSGEVDCVIDGVTITKGQASSIGSYHRGGAIYCASYNSLTIQNCVFKENHTTSQADYIYGGVIYVGPNCYLNVKSCLFDKNQTTVQSSDYIYGNTLYANSNSTVTFEDVEIAYSKVTSYYYIQGGEFYMTSASYKFKNVNIHHGEYELTYYRYIRGGFVYATSCSGSLENVYMGNSEMTIPYSSSYGYFYGGVMYLDNCTTKFTNCIFANNVMNYTGTYTYFRSYGLFYVPSGTSSWDNCIIANNEYKANSSCYYYGIIAYLTSHTAKFNKCHFLKNKSNIPNYYTSSSYSYAGGGIKIYSSTIVTFNDCTFAYNTSKAGGGAISASYSSASVTINNSTFYKNEGYYGGAMFSYGNIAINNSIFWNNSSSYGSDIYTYSSSYIPTLTNTCFSSGGISGSYNPISCINSDPYFKDTGMNPVTGDCTFSDVTMIVTGTPGTSAFLTEIMRGDMIYLTSDGDIKALVVTEVVSDTELKVAGYYSGTIGTGAATVLKMDFNLQHTTKGDINDSPCVDSGDDSKVLSATDIAGNIRIADGNGDSTATVDMGAYELQ